jgi:hypothetical protein
MRFPRLNRFNWGLAALMADSKDPNAKELIPWLDRTGLAALQAGNLIVLITFFTSDSHVDIPAHDSIAADQSIGIPLIVAALAALVCEDEVFSE